MGRVPSILAITSVLSFAMLAGCRGGSLIGSQSPAGNSSVVLAMTDLPPSTVTILSAKVTLTGVTLNPGGVSLFSGAATVDLARLQTDIAYIATATKIPAGNYTSVMLTFSTNPMLTIENDTGSAIVSGATTCAVGAICTIAPTTVANLSTTVPLSSFSIAANSTAGLLIDVSLDNLLSASLGADFSAGTSVTPFTPAGTGAPAVGAEDVVGQVGTVSASSNTLTLTNAIASYDGMSGHSPSLKVDGASTFFQFPSSVCTTAGFSCLKSGQILSVDIGIQSDGSLLARNIQLEDADSTDTEVEGIITSTNVGSQQFNIVIQSMSAASMSAVSVLGIGKLVTVQYSASPQTPFDIDLVHADNVQVSTSGFLFAAPADLTVGQQVSIRLHSILPGGQLMADRVRLRSSRITANVGQLGAPNIGLSSFPSIFSGHGVAQILAQTSPSTIYFEIGSVINSSTVDLADLISVRGPLFSAGGSSRTLIATKVVLKQP